MEAAAIVMTCDRAGIPCLLIKAVSDGVTGGEEECAWLCEMMATRFDGDVEKLVRQILNRASENGQDDLSVMVTEIMAAPVPGEESAA